MKHIEPQTLRHWPATRWLILTVVVGWSGDALAQAPAITRQPQSANVAAGMRATFNVQASGTGTLRYLWQFNQSSITGATNAVYTLTNASAIAAGENFAIALKPDGTVIAWGSNSSGQTNVPPGATNVVSISTKQNHCLALRADGSAVAWGSNSSGKTNVPATLTNAVAIAAGGNHNVVLRNNGTVVAWDNNTYGQINVPFGLAGVVAVTALARELTGFVWAIACQINAPDKIRKREPVQPEPKPGRQYNLDPHKKFQKKTK